MLAARATDDLSRLALLRCMMPLRTDRSIMPTVELTRSAAAVSPWPSTAVRNFFSLVRSWLLAARLRAVRRAVWRMRLIADL